MKKKIFKFSKLGGLFLIFVVAVGMVAGCSKSGGINNNGLGTKPSKAKILNAAKKSQMDSYRLTIIKYDDDLGRGVETSLVNARDYIIKDTVDGGYEYQPASKEWITLNKIYLQNDDTDHEWQYKQGKDTKKLAKNGVKASRFLLKKALKIDSLHLADFKRKTTSTGYLLSYDGYSKKLWDNEGSVVYAYVTANGIPDSKNNPNMSIKINTDKNGQLEVLDILMTDDSGEIREVIYDKFNKYNSLKVPSAIEKGAEPMKK